MAASNRNSAAALVSEISVAMPSLAARSQTAQSAGSWPADLDQGTSGARHSTTTATSDNPRHEANPRIRLIIVLSVLRYSTRPAGRMQCQPLVLTPDLHGR